MYKSWYHWANDVVRPMGVVRVDNVLVSPSIVTNLISVRKLTRDNNVSIEFDPHGFSIEDLPTRTVMLRCESSGELYPLRQPRNLALSASAETVDLWHQHLGHPGSHSLVQVLRSFDFRCNKSAAHVCHSCQLGKHTRLPFSSSNTVSYFPFQLVHSDVWTSPVYSNSGYKYYLVLLDDFTHYVWTFPIRNKFDVLALLRVFHAYIRTQFGLPCRLTMGGNSTTTPCAASSPSTASLCGSHARTRPRRTGRPSRSSAL